LVGIGFMDRVTVMGSQFLYKNEILIRGTRDQVRTYQVSEIVRATAIVNGVLVTYTPDTDLEMVEGASNAVTWLTDGPPVGTQYSLTYWALPIFYVWTECPVLRHHEGQRLPTRLLLQRKDRIHTDRPVDLTGELS